MKRWNRYNTALLATLTGVCLWGSSCQEEAGVGSAMQQEREIRLAATYPCQTLTRATDAGFADGDAVGIFVMDYAGDTPEAMALQGNRASNVKFTYQETTNTWNSATTLFWGNTAADFIGYYPFNESLESVTEHRFEVATDQNRSATDVTLGGYEASDLLWAKTANVEPTAETVQLQYNHLMAGVTIRLERGEGFTDAEWVDAEKIIRVCSTVPSANVNLSTGTVTVSTEKSVDILPYAYNAEWRAVVVPQSVEAGKALIALTVDGQNYELTKQEVMDYQSGRMHTFTIEIQKREASGEYAFALLDEGVTAWLDDSEFHANTVRDYVVVEVSKAGTLAESIKALGLDYKTIRSMKVTGPINQNVDVAFMRDSMSRLTALNLKEVQIVGVKNEYGYDISTPDALGGLSNMNLNHIVFPDRLKEIQSYAFENTPLSGSLVIPEGVVKIGGISFSGCSFTGELKLPSTLKFIGVYAFQYSGLGGELHLPEGLEYLGTSDPGGVSHLDEYSAPFRGCNFTGDLYLPKSLKAYGPLGLPNMTGNIVIPQGVTEIAKGTHLSSKITSVHIPEGMISIGEEAFAYSKLQGELVIPSSCRRINKRAFAGTRISNVVWHDRLQMEEYVFENCQFLRNKVTIPHIMDAVPIGLFAGCSQISELELHENVATIGEKAFKDCLLLNSITCMSEEPPVIGTDAFANVPKGNVTVRVPASALIAYKQADGWREFKRITAYSDFVCQPATACALNNERRQTLVLYAKNNWSVEHLPDWCSISTQSGTGKTELTLTVHKMPHGTGNRTDSIVFRLDDTDYTTYCKVSQYDYEYEEDEKITLQTHTKGTGIDVIFLGDGYDGEAHSKGEFLNLVKEQVEYFFGVEPYKSHREYFNVYAAISLSQEEGINTLNTYRDTYFNTVVAQTKEVKIYYECPLIEPEYVMQIIPDANIVFNYAQEQLGYSDLGRTLVVLVPNTTDYGGNTVINWDGTTISVCPPSIQPYPQDTRGVLQQEACGHGFGKLAEERKLYNKFPKNEVKKDIAKYHAYGWYQNITTTSERSQLPWADFIFDPRYSNEVDVFEGGALYTRGIYRCEENSCMNYGIPYFNVMSRLDIMRRILNYAGETFTMDYFYAHDSKEWGESSLNTTRTPWQEMPEVNGGWGGIPMIVDDWNALSNEVKRLREEAKKKSNR